MKRLTPALRAASIIAGGAGDIDRLETGAVGGADQAGDVDDRVGAGAQSLARLSGRSSAPSTQAISSSGGFQPRVSARTS